MLVNFYCFTSHVYYFRLEIYNKQSLNLFLGFLHLKCIIQQLLDSVFVINVSVRVISLAFSWTDNSYLDIDNSAYHK